MLETTQPNHHHQCCQASDSICINNQTYDKGKEGILSWVNHLHTNQNCLDLDSPTNNLGQHELPLHNQQFQGQMQESSPEQWYQIYFSFLSVWVNGLVNVYSFQKQKWHSNYGQLYSKCYHCPHNPGHQIFSPSWVIPTFVLSYHLWKHPETRLEQPRTIKTWRLWCH